MADVRSDTEVPERTHTHTHMFYGQSSLLRPSAKRGVFSIVSQGQSKSSLEDIHRRATLCQVKRDFSIGSQVCDVTTRPMKDDGVIIVERKSGVSVLLFFYCMCECVCVCLESSTGESGVRSSLLHWAGFPAHLS